MKVLQVLPNLDSGGVERGTVEFARELVARGHASIVISNGGRLVRQLEAEGTRHIELPVHRKSLASLRLVRPLRRLLAELQPDIVHVRSRLPAWLIYLAWRGLPRATRPRLVSTFHGLYSVNFYSAVMARAEQIIAISHTVERYVVENYGQKYRITPDRLTVIQRGFDPAVFHPGEPDPAWLAKLYADYPQLRGKKLVLMPGRLSRWKGQAEFLQMLAELVKLAPDVHGVIVGDAEANKTHYRAELEQQAAALGLAAHVTFTGHRSDIAALYRLAAVVCHMSNKPEPFGRTLTEALACGAPVVAFDRGGAGESLAACFADGLVPVDDLHAFAHTVHDWLERRPTLAIPDEFKMQHQVEATLGVYERLLQQPR
jgi:glycosyltransferase involved in cell wall biosynthesis